MKVSVIIVLLAFFVLFPSASAQSRYIDPPEYDDYEGGGGKQSLLGIVLSVGLTIGAVGYLLAKQRDREEAEKQDDTSNYYHEGEDDPSTKTEAGSDMDRNLYGDALSEYESKKRDKNLYARLLVELDGDEAKVRARYIASRVARHSSEEESDDRSLPKSPEKRTELPSVASSLNQPIVTRISHSINVDMSFSDEQCFDTFRFSVLAEGAMRLYKFDNGNFAVRRGNQVYVYSNYDHAYEVYVANSMSRDVYLKHSIRQFTC